MSHTDTIEHNSSLCCICMDAPGDTTNFSYWKCTSHADSICTGCRDHILSQGRDSSNCPLCRSQPVYHNITRKNSENYINNRRNEGIIINNVLSTIIINYINLNIEVEASPIDIFFIFDGAWDDILES